jgi:inosine-uridine nucleoside N-ribohydrolase
MPPAMTVILDVDTGKDDALALGLVLVDPGIDLVAATTVAGNADIVHTTRNTLTVLEWFRRARAESSCCRGSAAAWIMLGPSIRRWVYNR